jgi:hypothetical protein
VDFARGHDPSTFERFRAALKELRSASSALIVETAETLDLASVWGLESDAARARTMLDHLERLRAEMDLALSLCGPVRRKPDQRSHWHATALAFASFIEYGYQAAGTASPSRSHIASPLVRAVGDLLAELGITCTPDQIAKVLHARTLRERSEKKSPR